MARVLHLLPRTGIPLASIAIRGDLEAGDEVTVALLADAAGDGLPDGVRQERVPSEVSYEQLLEQIFAADRVVTW